MKKKTLLTSILAIVMCFSLITGATFALFTSEDKVNIAITSGKVEVTATVENFEFKTLTKDWAVASNNPYTIVVKVLLFRLKHIRLLWKLNIFFQFLYVIRKRLFYW